MAYQVILKRTLDKEAVARIATEVATMSGASPDQVASALSTKNISIGKDFSEEKADELKDKFELLGGSAQVINLNAPIVNNDNDDDDDEEEEDEGRLLSHEEYVKALNSRADIFYTEKEKKLKIIMPIMMVLGVLAGIYLTNVSLQKIAPDFYEKHMEERTVTLKDDIDKDKPLEDKKEKKKEKEFKKEKKTLKPKKAGSAGRTGGGGDPRARVTKKGVLGIISGAVSGVAVANADPLGKGGYASGIDAVLSGVGGLKKGGGGAGRAGAAGIGFGAGYGSGFGGGGGGVDDLLGSLMGGGSSVKLKKKGNLKVRQPSGAGGASMTGGRSRASIMRVVRQNMASLKYAYNGRLREKPGLQGKITVKWAIDEFGKVLFCKVTSSTMSDPAFEKIIVQKIKRWAFGKIDKPGDVTEVSYPFVFHQ